MGFMDLLTINNVLVLPMLLLVPVLFNGLSLTYTQYLTYHAADKPFAPLISDMYLTLVSTSILCAVRAVLVKYVLTPLGDYMLPSVEEKKKWSVQGRMDRVNRFGTCAFKFIYYVFITTWSYSVLSQYSWWPTQLGGRGAFDPMEGAPFVSLSEGLKWYYMIQLGYHFQSLVFHVAMTKRNDYIEMTLHHCCAVFLVLFSYYNGYFYYGSCISFLHDVSDVFVYGCKVMVDTKWTKVTLTSYVSLLSSWAYMRLYVLPVHMVPIALVQWQRSTEESNLANETVSVYLIYMLYVLIGLHVYWFCLFLLMGFNFLKKGKTEDFQQKCGEVNFTAPKHVKAAKAD